MHTDDPAAIASIKLWDGWARAVWGRVYPGIDRAGKHVAVKVVHPALARDEMFRRRFRQEGHARCLVGH